MNSNPHLALKGFPHNEEVKKRYFLKSSGRPDDVRKIVKSPRQLCFGKQGRPIFGIFRFFAILTAITALVISLIKDSVDKDSLLLLTIIELVFALVSVSTTLLKHCFTWSDIKQESTWFENENTELKETEITPKCSNKRPGFFITLLIIIWIIPCLLLIFGVVVCYLLDQNNHSRLKFTEFPTSIVILIICILDSIIAEKLEGMSSNLATDRYTLLIHGIKEELYEELRKHGRDSRIDEIDKYLRSDKTLDLDENTSIIGKNLGDYADESTEEYEEEKRGEEKKRKVHFEKTEIEKMEKEEAENLSLSDKRREETLEIAEDFVVLEMDDVVP